MEERKRSPELEASIKERNEAIFSLDRERIEAYMRKYDIEFDYEDPTMSQIEKEFKFLGSHAQTYLAIKSAPPELVKKSKKWLANGYAAVAVKKSNEEIDSNQDGLVQSTYNYIIMTMGTRHH